MYENLERFGSGLINPALRLPSILASFLLAACSALEPEVPEGCVPRYETVYQPAVNGSGGGQVRNVYTGFDCPSPQPLEAARPIEDVLVDDPPEPWQRVDGGAGYAATPASLGVDNPSVPVPGTNMYDQVFDRRILELMRHNVVLRIADGFFQPPGSSSRRDHPYLIAPPERLDALIAGLEHRDIQGSPAQVMPTEVSYGYRGREAGLHVFSNRGGRVYFISEDRTTQCEGILPGFWETGRFEYTDRHPAIDCQIGRFLPDYDVRVSLPAQYHAHVGVLMSQADEAASALIERDRER